jgi:hypothetical protein
MWRKAGVRDWLQRMLTEAELLTTGRGKRGALLVVTAHPSAVNRQLSGHEAFVVVTTPDAVGRVLDTFSFDVLFVDAETSSEEASSIEGQFGERFPTAQMFRCSPAYPGGLAAMVADHTPRTRRRRPRKETLTPAMQRIVDDRADRLIGRILASTRERRPRGKST